MVTRAFRIVANVGEISKSELANAVTNCGFTFSDDPTEDSEIREYWYELLMAKKPVDGEMLRVLMNRIYDYMNPEV